MRGVDTPALQRILRHRDPRITMSTYVHLTPGYLRGDIDRLTFEEKKPDPAPDTTPLLPAPSNPRLRPDRRPGRSSRRSGTCDGAGYRSRTDDIQLGKASPAVTYVGSELQAAGIIHNRSVNGSHTVDGFDPISTGFVPPVFRRKRTSRSRENAECLLNVKEVARQLGVCTRTVYELCTGGALPHIRILNAIRIAPADLRKFVAAKRARRTPPAAG
jgi:excisionase family DNA binding protein